MTTTRDGSPVSPDLVERRFKADGPNKLWVADITYVPTWAGFLFLAVVIDVWSRKVVGWSMANDLKTEIVLAALDVIRKAAGPDNVQMTLGYLGTIPSTYPINAVFQWMRGPEDASALGVPVLAAIPRIGPRGRQAS